MEDKYLYSYVHCNFYHNCQGMEITQMSVGRRMDFKNVYIKWNNNQTFLQNLHDILAQDHANLLCVIILVYVLPKWAQ